MWAHKQQLNSVGMQNSAALGLPAITFTYQQQLTANAASCGCCCWGQYRRYSLLISEAGGEPLTELARMSDSSPATW